MSLIIRPARPGEASLVCRFCRGLAEYEKNLDAFDATPELMHAALFGETPRVFCDIAERDGTAVGSALWFYNFSGLRGRHGIYLEDLFVDAAHRGRGIGGALLARLARRCVEEGLPRFDWSVLGWNSDAIGFYESLGAEVKDEARNCRIAGPALDALAARV